MASHTIISCGTKLLRMFRIVQLKISTFSSTLVFENGLAELNSSIACLISPVYFSVVPDLS